MLADGGLFDPIRRGKLTDSRGIVARRQPQHQLVPYGRVQRLAAPEQFVAAQGLLVALLGA